VEMNKDFIFNSDCVLAMGAMPDGVVDLVVTSPPYDEIYRSADDYESDFDFEGIADNLYDVVKEGGVVVWVVKDQVKDGSETGNSFRQALYFKDIGFNLHDTMVYQREEFPFPEQNRYYQTFEYMFVFSKGAPKTFNPLKVRTKGYSPSESSTQRNDDGSVSRMKYEQGKCYRTRSNVWVYGTGYNKSTNDEVAFDHPAIFPEKLARDHILSWSDEGDLVFDPMCGSGTTCKMAKKMGRHYIGIDISKEYCEIARERLEKVKPNPPDITEDGEYVDRKNRSIFEFDEGEEDV